MKYQIPLSTLDHRRDRDNWLFFVQRFIDSVLGGARECRLCRAPSVDQLLCRACIDDLPWRKTPWTRQLPLLDSAWVGFDFAYPIRQLVHRTKYNRDIASARMLGELCGAQLARDIVVPQSAALFPVPLARSRMLVRGFNQAIEISLPMSHHLQLPIDVVSVYKPHARQTQTTLNAVGRKVNIRDAFKHRRQLTIDTAIIVDDVLTTGATVSAMARVLRRAGAKQVIAYVVAAA